MSTLKTKGLSAQEVSIRTIYDGPNRLAEAKKRNLLLVLLSQFCDVMIIILIISAGISIYLGDRAQGFIILGIVTVNALFGFIQEFRTEKALDALKAMATPTAKVIREGQLHNISAEEIVRGDVVMLGAGDRIPADGVILECAGAAADESLLSGESMSVDKDVGHSLYMGTTLLAGHAIMEVTDIGMSTEMGKIAGMLRDIDRETTPLQQKLNKLGKVVATICIAVCAMVTVLGIVTGKSAYTMFVSGVSLAVAAIPEGLPAIVTASLAMGVGRMAKRKALVRKLPAVETLGCATVICTDKTGTLTQNRMSVSDTWFVPGMEPRAMDVMVSCVNISYGENGEIQGTPTETALYRYASSTGIQPLTILDEIPFDSTKKYMAVKCSKGAGTIVLAKGAPEVIMPLCRRSASDLYTAEVQLRRMAEGGLRVIALAYGRCPSGNGRLNISAADMQLVGLVGLMDPPRPESAEAVRKCHNAGIKTIMITGDSKSTAMAIGRRLDLLRPGDGALTGADIDSMTPEELAAAAKTTRVFARVTPAHKLAIVRSLKQSGEIVAMTGDGVNDSPAVKEAHIGVSMGKGGSDVTREASAISLMDDNFATLVHAIEEGRLIYSNILRFVRYMLAGNLGEVLTMVIAIMLNLPLPLLPTQLLLVNVITDGLPAMALGFSPTYSELMQVPPRDPNSQIINKKTALQIAVRGLLIGCSTVGMFVLTDYMGGNLSICRGSALSMLIVSQLVYVFGCNRDGRRFSLRNIFDNKMLVAATLISLSVLAVCLYCPPLAAMLEVTPPTLPLWLLIAGISLSGILF